MKYSTRLEKLRNAIENEVARTPPNVDGILEAVDRYESVNLKTIDKLQRKKKAYSTRINGALKQVINSHGPITRNLIGSATKRIFGSLIELEKENHTKIKVKYYIFGALTCILIKIVVYLLKITV